MTRDQARHLYDVWLAQSRFYALGCTRCPLLAYCRSLPPHAPVACEMDDEECGVDPYAPRQEDAWLNHLHEELRAETTLYFEGGWGSLDEPEGAAWTGEAMRRFMRREVGSGVTE